MSTKSLKFFGPSTTKWQPWKNFFAKLNGNHLSMVNIFKLCKHQTFGLMKCIIWAKSNLATINPVCVKIGFTINGPSNMLFFNFWLFSFLFFFKRLLPNDRPFQFLWNLQRNSLYFFVFSKWKKHYNFTFDGTFKMCYFALC